MSRKSITPQRTLHVTATVLSDPYATVAMVEYGSFTATGAAKKEPGDIYDPDIDIDLAVGRALASLGAQMIRDGQRKADTASSAQKKQQLRAAMRNIHQAEAAQRTANRRSGEPS